VEPKGGLGDRRGLRVAVDSGEKGRNLRGRKKTAVKSTSKGRNKKCRGVQTKCICGSPTKGKKKNGGKNERADCNTSIKRPLEAQKKVRENSGVNWGQVFKTVGWKQEEKKGGITLGVE